MQYKRLGKCGLNAIRASRISQIVDNVTALELVPRLSGEICQRIAEAVGDYSESWVTDSPWHYED